jgi:hypothetical protein
MSDVIKLTKGGIVIGFVVLILLIAGFWYFGSYQPKMAKADKVEAYKKQVYESILCQYKCPIVNTTVNNETRPTPDVACIKECVNVAKATNITGEDISNAELKSDNLASDILLIIDSCTQTNTVSKMTNYTGLYDCAGPQLEGLKQNYSYLA